MTYEIHAELSQIETAMLKEGKLRFLSKKMNKRVRTFIESARTSGIIGEESPAKGFYALKRNITVQVKENKTDIVRHLTCYAVHKADLMMPYNMRGLYAVFAIAEYDYSKLAEYYQIEL